MLYKFVLHIFLTYLYFRDIYRYYISIYSDCDKIVISDEYGARVVAYKVFVTEFLIDLHLFLIFCQSVTITGLFILKY